MTLRDDLLPLINEIRSIPGQLGLRPYSVAIVIGTWSGTYVGRGSEDTETAEITEANGQPPKVRFPNDEQIALGNLGKGDAIVGPITPDHSGGGTPLSDLVPAVQSGQTVHAILTGPAYPTGARFRIKDVKTDRALHWTLTLTPVDIIPE